MSAWNLPQAPGYRDFRKPDGLTSVDQWMDWLVGEGVLHSAAPFPRGACTMCGGAMADPHAYRLCPTCSRGSRYLEGLLPATYSLDSGLESMLHRYKDFDGYTWMSAPLASLLYTMFTDHSGCLTREVGPITLATSVPSATDRGFSPSGRLVDSIARWPVEWDLDIIGRAHGVPRPPRREIRPEAYVVRGHLSGGTVLLFDDTWTSGASLFSAAAALRRAGAGRVVGLTLGRQLNRSSSFGNNLALVHQATRRGWSGRCLLCH